MDWLRRNWPDLLIGIALVAVIAGIIATLISGGSFFPLGQGNRNANQTSSGQSTVTTPLTSGTTTTPSTTSGTGSSGTTGTGTTAPSGSTGSQPSGGIAVLPPAGSTTTGDGTTGATGTDGGTAGSSQTGGQDGTSAASTTGTGSTGGQVTSTPATSTTPSTSTLSSTATTATTSTTATTPVSTAAAGQGAPYRVSVGAFGSIENANRQAETFRAAGYPVFLGTQGSLNLVLVGPYDTEAQARAVADRIRSDAALNVSDPTVYVLEGADSGSAQQTSATTPTTPTTTGSTTSTAPATSSTTSATTAPATVASGRYLQVGAYGSRDSSLPQRERVEGLGFVVSEREESGLIKLLIGPFDASGLEQAQARLQAAGVESFPR